MSPVYRFDKKDCHHIGKILKTHGYQGEVVVYLNMDDIEQFSSMEYFFIDMDEELIPYFIHDFRIRDDSTAIIGIDDIHTPEEARLFQNRDLYLPLQDLETPRDKGVQYNELIGYTVTDKIHGYIGIIDGIINLPDQSLFRIMKEEKEILIPVVNEFIVKIDYKKKQIAIDAPKGLINLYL
jgi:16S rRNA processing protein RimM